MFRVSISIALLCACAVLAQNSGPEFRQVVDDDSVTIGLNPKNFAVSNPELEQKFGWNSVSVDGDRVTIVTEDCQVIERDLDSLGDDERAELDKASQKLRQIPQSNGLKLNTDGGQALFAGQTASSLNDFNKVSTTQDGKTIRKMGTGHYTIMDQNGGLPDDIKRVSVDGDQITTVYNNGSVRMQPKSCAKGTEKQLINDAQSTMDLNQGVSEPLSYMQDPPMMPSSYGNPPMMSTYGNQPMMSPYGNPQMMSPYGNPSMNPSTMDPQMMQMMQQEKLRQNQLMDQLMKNQQMQMQNKLAMQQEELEFQQNMANRQRQQQILEQGQILARKQKQLELEEQMMKEQEQMHLLHMHQMYSSM